MDEVIHAPQGTRGRYLGGDRFDAPTTNPLRPAAGAPITSHTDEAEFLIERGSTFTIEDARQDPITGRWTVELRITEQGSPTP